MSNPLKTIRAYKERNFSSWAEFIATFGVCKLEDGGFMLFIYGWGGALAMLGMVLMLKYMPQ